MFGRIARPATLAALAGALMMGTAAAQTNVKIGILGDRSGAYSDISGEGSVVAAKLAVEDFKPDAHGLKVEIVSADHQNKPDVGAAIARQWYDRDNVDMITDGVTSSVALAISQVTKEKNKVFIDTGAGTADLTGPQCTPNTIHWVYDTVALANGTGGAMVKRGGNTWFFLTADYVFGQTLQRDTSAVITKNGGKVVGSVKTPFPTSDFSSFLLQAQARAPRSSAWPMPEPTRSTRSSRRASSASPRAGRRWPAFWSSPPTCIRWAPRSPRVSCSPSRSTGT